MAVVSNPCRFPCVTVVAMSAVNGSETIMSAGGPAGALARSAMIVSAGDTVIVTDGITTVVEYNGATRPAARRRA